MPRPQLERHMWMTIIIIELTYIAISRTVVFHTTHFSFTEEMLFTLNRTAAALIALYFFYPMLSAKKTNYTTLRNPWLLAAMLLFLAIAPLESYMGSSTPAFKLFFAFTSIFVAIHEEVVYRGVIQELFMKHLSPFKAIFLTSLLFTLYHIGVVEWHINLYIQIFLAGIFLGVLYYKTQSLILVITLHTIYDALEAVTPIGSSSHSIISCMEGTYLMIAVVLGTGIAFRLKA